MAIKIAYLLLALAASCSCLDGNFGGAGDPSGIDPGFRLGLTSPSRDNLVPKIEPLALTRPGFNPIGAGPRSFDPDPRRPGPVNLPIGRFGVRDRVGPGGYIRRNLPSGGIRRPFVPGPGGYVSAYLPNVVRYPIDLRPGRHIPGNLPPGGINRPWPGGYVPENSPLRRYPLNPGWNQGSHDPFKPPGMNNGPFNYGPAVNGPFYRNSQMLPRQGDDFGPGGPPPRQPNQRPDFNQVNHRSRDDNDNEKDLPKGTVVVTVAAVNETDKGSVHANVTFSAVPKEGDNKETLKLGTKQHLNAAWSILDEILYKHKGEEQKSKASNDLEDVLNKLDLPKL